MKTSRTSGFTLVEIMVVIGIIGLLSSVILTSLNGARTRSRDGKRVSDIKNIQLALALYADANSGVYPINITSIAPNYIASLPKDPLNGGSYAYVPLSIGGSCIGYHLGSSLEDSGNKALVDDSDTVSLGTACPGAAVSDFSGADSGKCNSSDIGTACFDVTQ